MDQCFSDVLKCLVFATMQIFSFTIMEEGKKT